MASAKPSPKMPKPSSLLSTLLLFIPTSLLALAFLLLACNSLGFLHHLEVREESPHKKLTTLQDSGDGLSPPNSSSALRWSRSKSLLSSLHPDSQSKRFSTRVTEFFHGYTPNSSASSCKARFFMTWISELKAFGQRGLLSMESVFKFHPNACLLILSHTLDSTPGKQLLKPLKDRGFRVSAMSPDFDFLFNNTPAQSWFLHLRRGDVDPGEVPLGQNLSNLIRLAVLYRFGGVYIDTDVLVLKSLLGLNNVIGAQAVDAGTGRWSRLNNAVMIFAKGHPLVLEFIDEFVQSFDGNRWGFNGPYLVSRVVMRVAGRDGFEFTVLPPAAFYPVDWTKIQGLFRGPQGGRHSEWVSAKVENLRQESFALHLWNRNSREMKIEEGSVVGRIIFDCCILCNFSASTL